MEGEVKLGPNKTSKISSQDARPDLVRGVFLLTLLVQLLCVRWLPPSAHEEALFQAAGGLWRGGTPVLSETPEALALAQQIVEARPPAEPSDLGFLMQDAEGLSFALAHAPPGATLALVPAHLLGDSLQRLTPGVEARYRASSAGNSSEFWAHLLAALLGPLLGAICCAAVASGALSMGATRPSAALAAGCVAFGSSLGSASGWPESALLASAFLSYAWATLLHLAGSVAAGKTVGRFRFWAVGSALAIALLMDMRIWPLVLVTLAFGEAGLRRSRGGSLPFGQIAALVAIMGPALAAIAWQLLGSGPLAQAGMRYWQVHNASVLAEASPQAWLRAGWLLLVFAPCLIFAGIGAVRLLWGVDRLVGVLTVLAMLGVLPLMGDRNAHGPVMLLPLLVFVGPAMGVGLGFSAGYRRKSTPFGMGFVGLIVLLGLLNQVAGSLVDPGLVRTLDAEAGVGQVTQQAQSGPRTALRWRILRRQQAVGDGSFPLGEVFAVEDSVRSGTTVNLEGHRGRLFGHLALARLGRDMDLSLLLAAVVLGLVLLAGLGLSALLQGLDRTRWP